PAEEVSAGLREKVVRLIDPSGKVGFEDALRILLGYAEADALDKLVEEAERRIGLAEAWAEGDMVVARLPRKLCEAVFTVARVEPKPENLPYALDRLLRSYKGLQNDYSWLVDDVVKEVPPFKVIVEASRERNEIWIRECELGGKPVSGLRGLEMEFCKRYGGSVVVNNECLDGCILKRRKEPEVRWSNIKNRLRRMQEKREDKLYGKLFKLEEYMRKNRSVGRLRVMQDLGLAGEELEKLVAESEGRIAWGPGKETLNWTGD
ncbi:MAG: hypothetical protein DRN49_06270, partial [Thaumarchaeota archaeon]